MRVVIHWVEDRPVDIPYLLANKIHSAPQESQLKKVKYSFPCILQKIIEFVNPMLLKQRLVISTNMKIYLGQNHLFIKHIIGNIIPGKIMMNCQDSLRSRMRNYKYNILITMRNYQDSL